jgi:DNA-directed RNA polymerase specialized sigma subunit
MARNKNDGFNVISQQVQSLAQGVALTAKMITEERKRNNDFIKAQFETMSRRERPIFVHSLRQSGYTQQEIADTVDLSQSAICQYEKKYKQQFPEK